MNAPTFPEFLRDLETACRGGQLTFERGGVMRIYSASGKVICGETAVALVRTGQFFKLNEWRQAAVAIGQPEHEAQAVVNAFDLRNNYSRRLRRLLKEAMRRGCAWTPPTTTRVAVRSSEPEFVPYIPADGAFAPALV